MATHSPANIISPPPTSAPHTTVSLCNVFARVCHQAEAADANCATAPATRSRTVEVFADGMDEGYGLAGAEQRLINTLQLDAGKLWSAADPATARRLSEPAQHADDAPRRRGDGMLSSLELEAIQPEEERTGAC